MGLTIVKEPDPATLSDLYCAICHEPMERVDNREPEDSDLIELEDEASHYPTEADCKHVFRYVCFKTWLSEPDKITCPLCRVALKQNVDEIEIWKLQFKQALELWKEESNDWGLDKLKKQMEGRMDTNEWVVELIEVYTTLLWSMNADKWISSEGKDYHADLAGKKWI